MTVGPIKFLTANAVGSYDTNLPNGTAGVFCVLINGTANYTLQTAIDSQGSLLDDSLYKNFTTSVQDTFQCVGRFVLKVNSLGAGSSVRLEWRVIS